MNPVNKNDAKIVRYADRHREQLIDVWERSVLATHHFLGTADFQTIKGIVDTIDFNKFDVYCLLHGDTVSGFIGVANRKIEMLFLAPDYFGRGLGSLLMNFVIKELGVTKVDVNEQNGDAVRFYTKWGFETYERTDKDDQGFDYPLLRMELKKGNLNKKINNR